MYIFRYSLLLLFLFFLPSCSRILNWGKTTFNQGCSVEDYLCEFKGLIRSKSVYDQLSTLGIFDAIWLTPKLVEVYNQHSKNKLKVQGSAFFVLAFADRTDYNPLDNDFTNEWAWKVSLLANGKKLQPKIKKCMPLPAEFKLLFSDKWSRFKSSYYVEFDKVDMNGDVSLCFTSAKKKASLDWLFDNGKLVDPELICNYEKNCKSC